MDADRSSNPVDIPGATDSTYTVISADVGRAIRVKVSFTDDVGYDEGPLASNALPAGGTVTCDGVWCATLYVQPLGGGSKGCANSSSGDHCSDPSHLSEDAFTHASTDYSVTSVQVRSNGQLRLWMNPNIAAGSESLALHVGSDTFAFQAADEKDANNRFWNSSGLSWSNDDAVELKLTLTTFVSNTAETASLGTSTLQAQSFETGANADGYTISEVQIQLGTLPANPTTVVRIREDNSGEPGDLVAELTSPATLTANSLNTFTAPADTTLAPGKTYWITVNEGILNGASFAQTEADDETGETGWSIGDNRIFRNNETEGWNTGSTTTLLIAIIGTTGGYVASTDAKLSDLALEDATGGNAITVTPGFASDEYEYEASVANSVSRITVTPTKNDAGASVAYLDGDDNPLSDADTSQSGHQVDVTAGENTIKVKVTAEDDTATATYTVTVARAGRPGKVILSEKLLSLTEGNGAYYSVRLNRQPAADVTVTIGGHAGTNVTPTPTSLTFTTSNWSQVQWVFVSTTADTNTTNESVRLTHTATSADSLFDGITIPSVIVNVDDQDAPDHHIRTITVPYDLPLGETALPEEEFEVWIGPPFEETIEGVTQGHRWSPSGIWGLPDADIIWVVDPIHFGIHALKLSALKQGRVERHIAADTSEFDQRFNYRCHFSESRASGYGNPSLTVMWGSPTRVLIANESSGTLDAYDRDSSITNQCYTRNVTSWAANGQSYSTEDENFKSPFGFMGSIALPLGQLTVRGIWASGTQVWLSGPTAGVYTIDLDTGGRAIAPGYEAHGTSYGLWSDGTTMWVAADSGWLRAYNLTSGSRRAQFDIRIQTYGMPPGDIWSDGETIWITNLTGLIDAYRLPGASGGSTTLKATEADPLTASFALAPEAHDGESGFKLRIDFSDDVEITPEDMRDHALLVSGGTVTDAARVKGGSDLWELTVEPAGPGPVSILVAQDRACTDQGALCTADGRSLTVSLALRVPGPPAPQANSVATGRPSITGTAQVGETLAAHTSDIGDADGLTNVSYSYQWLANDGTSDTDITDATDSAYTLAAGDEGQTIQVRVSFTDDAGNEETLTSTATEAVSLTGQQQQANSVATGRPSITGTAQVGETLAAHTSDIGDADGLANVSYSYQWIRNDGTSDTDIEDATDSTYTLAAGDEGQTIKVRVTFTDDAGNGESLTSVATNEVANAGPTEPPPAPENLTAVENADGSVTLTWDAPDDDSVTGYQILRRIPAAGEGAVSRSYVPKIPAAPRPRTPIRKWLLAPGTYTGSKPSTKPEWDPGRAEQ